MGEAATVTGYRTALTLATIQRYEARSGTSGPKPGRASSSCPLLTRWRPLWWDGKSGKAAAVGLWVGLWPPRGRRLLLKCFRAQVRR